MFKRLSGALCTRYWLQWAVRTERRTHGANRCQQRRISRLLSALMNMVCMCALTWTGVTLFSSVAVRSASPCSASQQHFCVCALLNRVKSPQPELVASVFPIHERPCDGPTPSFPSKAHNRPRPMTDDCRTGVTAIHVSVESSKPPFKQTLLHFCQCFRPWRALHIDARQPR